MSHPQSLIPNPQSLPRWLKRNVPKGNANHFTAKLIGRLGLQTVCDHAKCPNRMECYSQKTATFMILGDICTRGCRFCSVQKGKPGPVDPDEPRRVAEAARELGLEHVVITCVTRDDLPDGGAEHFCQTVAEVRRSTGATIEVLPSDFAGNAAAVDRLIEAAPQVYNHNTETVPRLFASVRNPQVRLRLDAGNVPPHPPPRSGHRAENGPDARAGRNQRGIAAKRWPSCSRPAAAC